MENKCILDPSLDCIGKIKAEEVARDVADLKTEISEIKNRNEISHKEFFNRIAVLEAHDQVQDANYMHILEKLTDITEKLSAVSTRLSSIEIKPAKKWESLVSQVLGALVAAILAIVFAKVGLNM